MRDDPQVTDLVTRASGGDRQAWDALAERYAPLIWSICRRYRLNGADAQDAGQAIWLRLAAHLDNFPDPAALPGWLATTTRRDCYRVQRAGCPPTGSCWIPCRMSRPRPSAMSHSRPSGTRRCARRMPACPPAASNCSACSPPTPVLYAEISAQLGISTGSIGPYRRRYLDKLRRDPAIARLINAEAATGK